MSADEILFEDARALIDQGRPFPTQFLIPDGDQTWRVVCHDLEAAGQNDLGIPPKVFAHGAVGMLLAALGVRECYAAEDTSAALIVTTFAEGRLGVVVQPYARDGKGRVVWGERTASSSTKPGPLGAALPLWRAVNRERSPMPPARQLIDDMVDSGFEIVVEERPIDPGAG